MPWFVKQETFLRPYAAMKPHLQAHRAWVEQLREAGTVLSSGYLVDGAGQPGGGGLLLLQAPTTPRRKPWCCKTRWCAAAAWNGGCRNGGRQSAIWAWR